MFDILIALTSPTPPRSGCSTETKTNYPRHRRGARRRGGRAPADAEPHRRDRPAPRLAGPGRSRHRALVVDPVRGVAVEGPAMDRRGTRPRVPPRGLEALESGELHLDKVAELTRFATPETESRCWCGRAACPAGRSGVRRTSRSAGRSRTSRASSGAARSLGERSTTGGASASRVSFRPRTGRRRGQGARRPGKHRAGHAGRGGTSRHRREARGRPRGAVLGPDRRRTRAGPNDGDRARPPRGVGPAGRVRGRGRSGDQLRVRRAARVQRAGPGPAGERERGPGAGRPDEPRASDVDGSSAEVP